MCSSCSKACTAYCQLYTKATTVCALTPPRLFVQVYTDNLQIAHLSASHDLQATVSSLAPWWVPHVVVRHSGEHHLRHSDTVLHKADGQEYLPWVEAAMGASAPMLQGHVAILLPDGTTLDTVEALQRYLGLADAEQRSDASSVAFGQSPAPSEPRSSPGPAAGEASKNVAACMRFQSAVSISR